VADLAGSAPTLVELAVENEASADPGADPHPEQVPVGAPGPPAVLAEDADGHVVLDRHRRTTECRRDVRAELDAIGEPRDVRGQQDDAGRRIHLTGCSDPDSGEVFLDRTRFVEGRPDRSDDRVDHVIRVSGLGREHPRAARDLLVPKDDRLDLRPAEIDACSRLRARHPTTSPRIGLVAHYIVGARPESARADPGRIRGQTHR
jgi:hypothetical protein